MEGRGGGKAQGVTDPQKSLKARIKDLLEFGPD
jgi:hypothetical protein